MSEQAHLPAIREISTGLIARAATRNEVLLAVIRIGFCTLSLARFLVLQEELNWGFVAMVVSSNLTAIAFSSWILLRSREKPLSTHFFYGSVSLDSLLCFMVLVPNVLWPWPTYTKIVHLPDIAAIYVVVVASGLRLSTTASWLSGALNFASCWALVALDWHIDFAGLPPAHGMTSMVLLLCVVSAGLAILLASRTRRLVEETGLLTWRQGMARRTLNFMLEEHHGTRSLLSAAKLRADQLLERSRGGDESFPGEEIRALHHVLGELVLLAVRSRERSFAELATLRGLRRVELMEVAESVVRVVAGRFPDVRFSLTGELGDGDVAIVGGNASFERILLNLLTNACEGDGHSGAKNVEVRFAPFGNGLRIRFLDDGPGLPEAVRKRAQDCITTKANGTGIGLYLVERLLHESGGTLMRKNRPTGGADIAVSLPALNDEAARSFEPRPRAGPLPGVVGTPHEAR